MNVLLVSQCHKNALKQTRRILDQFAERRGERTWQTAITWQGLDTLRRLLKASARKNTAVACHWIRGKDHSELLWIVGNASAFNFLGATPTNSTTRDVIKGSYENDWHNLQAISLLAALAALFHDLGKANATFQKKIKPGAKSRQADPLRHEWISLRLWEAFVGRDDDRAWLERLAALSASSVTDWLERLHKDATSDSLLPSPFKVLPAQAPLAQSIGWLMVSHHRLPTRKGQTSEGSLNNQPRNIYPDWCGARLEAEAGNSRQRKEWQRAVNGCWSLPQGLPIISQEWRKRARRHASRALETQGFLETPWLENPHVLHLARMVLMLADHFYSSQKYEGSDAANTVEEQIYANTRKDPDTGSRAYNQPLAAHLVGVEKATGAIAHGLPRLELQLPRIARHKGFQRRGQQAAFRWQDWAYDLAASLRRPSREHGFFGINMASTGCGKTLGNGRIMYALADPQQGARFTLALGLRVLTMQTGQAYRSRLGLGPDDLAVLVGGAAVRRLYEHHQRQENEREAQGRESSQDLLAEDSYVHFEGSVDKGPLSKWLKKNPRAMQLLSAPILACTIDHLMPATEGLRGGRQIAPMLRLMSSDLVLDEPDDFDLGDLHALSRLVNWAGLLGCRVLLSSATLPPALVEGLFQAYLEGRGNYQKNRGTPGLPLEVCCAWFDEFSRQSGHHADGQSFARQHAQWVDKRINNLGKKYEARRKAAIKEMARRDDEKEPPEVMARAIYDSAFALHRHHHTTDAKTGKRVSFGLVRMANIRPLVAVTRALAQLPPPAGFQVHFCCYHSQHPLLVRSALEQRLDRVLQRKEEQAVFREPEMRALLDRLPGTDHLFLVLATPVAEVGRDHDYDWAVIEPSSMRSIIQVAGRVRRHRGGECRQPNIHLLETNFRTMEGAGDDPTYCRPGFESRDFKLNSHQLSEILDPDQYQIISAAPRIAPRPNPRPQDNLVDLEHERLRAQMLGDEQNRVVPASRWWETRAPLSGCLQRTYPFRDSGGREQETYALLLDEESEQIVFKRKEPEGGASDQQNLLIATELECAPDIHPWGESDYLVLVENFAREMDLSPEECAWQFGTVQLFADEADRGWEYHPILGFVRKSPA